MLNVHAALNATGVTDLRFPTCAGGAATLREPCPLSGGLASWQNWEDISITGDLVAHNEITIAAKLVNDGIADAEDFLVSFGIYDFGTGTKLFHEIGTFEVDRLAAGATGEYSVTWTPEASGHQCVQVTIHYGHDENALNNTTQRNLSVAASRFDVRVENPYMVPAAFYIRATSERPGWPCRLSEPVFTIGGPLDCHRTVQVDFHAPRGAQPGDRANCNVEVFARPEGTSDSVSIGGVTVQTFVPIPCRVIGQIVGVDGRPLRDVRMAFRRDLPPGILPAPWDRTRKTRTDRDGVFDLDVLPGAHQTLTVTFPGLGTRSIPLKPKCGVGALRLELGPGGIRRLP
jgi:hypothetical protein